jgi:hypothetical protein
MLSAHGAVLVVTDCSAGLSALAGLRGRRKKTVSNFSLAGDRSCPAGSGSRAEPPETRVMCRLRDYQPGGVGNAFL